MKRWMPCCVYISFRLIIYCDTPIKCSCLFSAWWSKMFLPKLFKGLEILFCSLQMANHKRYQEDLFNFFLNCSVSLMSHLHSIIYRFDFNANKNQIIQISLNSLIYQCLRCYRSLLVILAILPWHSNAFFLRNLNMFKDC